MCVRFRIWDYLIKITQELGTTVIITTHYIEEAKLANKVKLKIKLIQIFAFGIFQNLS